MVFPVEQTDETPGKAGLSKGKRSLSELLRLHAEKGTDVKFSAEEALRVADVLGQWVRIRYSDIYILFRMNHFCSYGYYARPYARSLITAFLQINSGSSPYEGEDDFFARSQDDLSLPAKRLPTHEPNVRPRGQSESVVNSRPPSSAGTAKT